MDVKIYIGKEINKLSKKIKVSFVSNPTVNILVFTIKKGIEQYTLSLTLGVTVPLGDTNIETADNYFNYLDSFTFPSWLDPFVNFTIDGYNVYWNFTFDNQDDLEFTTYTSTGVIQITNSSSINSYFNFEKLDTYKDETIELTSKLSDIEKLSNVFMDFSNTFTIPASDNNNQLLLHYYDNDIQNAINANIRLFGYIEVDSLPFRYGKIELNGVNKKSFRPSSYKITFYSGLLQLTDLFGDDVLSELDYEKDDLGNLTKVYDSISKYSFDVNTSTIGGLLSGTYSNDVFIPMINSGDKKWDYNTGINDSENKDIYSDAGAISTYELRAALRVIKIIEAIEVKYGINFTRDFFGKAFFNNLFLWLNGMTKKTMYLNLENQFVNVSPPVNGQGYNPYLNFTDNTINIQKLNIPNNNNKFTLTLYWPYSVAGNLRTYDNTDFTLTVSYEDMRPGREGTVFYTKTKNFTQGDLHHFQQDFNADTLEMNYTEPLKFRIRLDSSKPLIWNNVRFETSFTWAYPYDMFVYYYRATSGSYNSYDIGLFMPEMKVLEFLQGIMKMFKLIITPLSSDEFYVNTIDGYYEDGNIIRLDDYVDNTNIDIEPLKIYNKIKFLYDKTNNVLGKKYRQLKDPVLDEIGYGDLRANYNSVEYNNSLEVKIPFDNMLYERLDNGSTLVPVNFLIGESIQVSDSGDVSANQSKPIMFFDNGIVSTTPIKFKIGDLSPFSQTKVRLFGTTDNELLSQVTHTLNFGAEIDPWHNTRIDNSLYLNYWNNWISTIYSTKQRKYTLDAYLPSILIDRLSLNDRLIISDNRYKINDFTVNLTTGKVNFVLFQDIYDPIVDNDNSFYGSTFSYTKLSDFTDRYIDGSYFLYGNISSYNSLPVNKIIKIKSNGQKDSTFNTQFGPDFAPNSGMRIYRYSDDKLLVAGSFSNFNATSSNVIRRLNPNGSIDTTFNVSTFGASSSQRYGNKVLVDSNNKILVGGLFTSYNSNTSNNLVRLTSTGSYDSSFVVNSGFNGVVSDIIETTTGTMSNQSYIVSGQFTTYKGISANSIVKLTATGSVDSSFSSGSGLLPSAPSYLLPSDNNSFIAVGQFTSYKGITASRIVKISATGSTVSQFNTGSGFNGNVNFIRYMEDNSIFISGSFSQYNGQTTYNAVVINNDATIKQTFTSNQYKDCYCVGLDVYGINISDNKLTKLTNNQGLSVLNDRIYQNSGSKFYAINVIGNLDWTIDKINLGSGVNWIDVNTPSGSGTSEISIFIKNNTTGLQRTMGLKIKSGSIEKWVIIYQYT